MGTRRQRSTHDMVTATARMLTATAKRIDVYPDLADLADLVGLERQLDAAIAIAVAALRAQGFTWGSIGETVGVTRQAAQQRWGKQVGDVFTINDVEWNRSTIGQGKQVS